MLEFYQKNKIYLLFAIGSLFLLRGITRLFKGVITVTNAAPEGFNPDFITNIWIGKIIMLLVGVVLTVWGMVRLISYSKLSKPEIPTKEYAISSNSHTSHLSPPTSTTPLPPDELLPPGQDPLK